MLIGLDFDNTLICYDQVFYEIALEMGLIPKDLLISKNQVRDYLRNQGREKQWTKLQGIVYGPYIHNAVPFPGALEFLDQCKQNSIDIRIISHKTEYAGFDETRTNLRKAALEWMEDHRFFQSPGLGLSLDMVLFGSTRQEKISHIHNSSCSHFIDDLEEVFSEDLFPADIDKICFAPNRQPEVTPGTQVMANWDEINEYFFGKTG